MPADVQSLMRLEVPLIVRLAEVPMPLQQVLALTPGSIVELGKAADEPLEILVNNKTIGLGSAVKVGENYGIRVTRLGDLRRRLEAVGVEASPAPPAASLGKPDVAAAATDGGA